METVSMIGEWLKSIMYPSAFFCLGVAFRDWLEVRFAKRAQD